jgi:hypothetical protein
MLLLPFQFSNGIPPEDLVTPPVAIKEAIKLRNAALALP